MLNVSVMFSRNILTFAYSVLEESKENLESGNLFQSDNALSQDVIDFMQENIFHGTHHMSY